MNRIRLASWIVTTRAEKSFLIAACIDVFLISLSFLETALWKAYFPGVERISIGVPTFVVLAGSVVIAFAAAAYIWLGMLLFMFKIDRRPVVSKCLLFIAFVFGTWVTATVYYFKVYRPFVRRTLITERADGAPCVT